MDKCECGADMIKRVRYYGPTHRHSEPGCKSCGQWLADYYSFQGVIRHLEALHPGIQERLLKLRDSFIDEVVLERIRSGNLKMGTRIYFWMDLGANETYPDDVQADLDKISEAIGVTPRGAQVFSP